MSKSSDVTVTCALADAIINAEIEEKDVNIDLIIIGYLLLAGLLDLSKRRKNDYESIDRYFLTSTKIHKIFSN
jgi:hypothetical protein